MVVDRDPGKLRSRSQRRDPLAAPVMIDSQQRQQIAGTRRMTVCSLSLTKR